MAPQIRLACSRVDLARARIGPIYPAAANRGVPRRSATKNSRILVHNLLQCELISVLDPENIPPAIDYHLIRLYVRTGRVFPIRTELLDRLTDQGTPRVEFHTDLRAAVEEAMSYSAAAAHLSIDQLNQIEWQIARSFCTRRYPRCNGAFLPEKPVDSELERLAERLKGCPLRCDCRGANAGHVPRWIVTQHRRLRYRIRRLAQTPDGVRNPRTAIGARIVTCAHQRLITPRYRGIRCNHPAPGRCRILVT